MAAQGSFLVKISAVDGATSILRSLNKEMAAMRAPADRLNREMKKFSDLSGLSALKNSFSGIINNAKELGNTLIGVVEKLGLIGGIGSVAGIVAMTRAFGAWGQQLQNNADSLGMSAARLGQWQSAFELAGGKAEDAPKLFETLQLNLRKAFVEGDATLLTAFQQIGVSADDYYKGRIENVQEKTLQALRDPRIPNALKITLRNLIQGGFSPIQFEKEGTKGFFEEAVKRSGVSDKQVKDAQNLDHSFRQLQESAKGLSNAIIGELAPVFAPLITQFADFLDKNREAIATKVGKWAHDLYEWVKNINWDEAKKQFNTFKDTIISVGERVGGLINRFSDLDQPLFTIFGRSVSIKQGFELLFDMMLARYLLGFITPVVRMTLAVDAFAVSAAAAFGETAIGKWLGETALAAFAGRAAKFLLLSGKLLGVAGAVGSLFVPSGNTNEGEQQSLDARGRYGARGDAALKEYKTRSGGLSIMPSIGLGTALGASQQQLQKDINNPGIDRTSSGQPTPNGQPAGPVTPVSSNTKSIDKAYADWKYFQSKGYTPEQSVGLVANFMRESGNAGYEKAVNEIGATGKAQWLGARKALFERWYGHPLSQSTSEEQTEFAARELQTTEKRADTKLRQTSSAYDAGYAASKYFERPENADITAPQRGEYAAKLLPTLQAMDAKRAQNGQIDVNVNHNNAPPGSSVSVDKSGPMFAPDAPSVQTSLPSTGPN